METKWFDLDSRAETLRERRQRAAQALVADFDEKLDLSWIFHDHALEGIVLSYHELKAAIDKRIISDVSLIPMYEEIKNYKAAIEWVREAAKQPRKKKGSITLETLKTLHGIVTPDEKLKGSPWRKENPLHRLYFHEIAAPDKVPAKMKRLVEWLDEEECLHLHPVERAARAHWQIMAIYPWPKNSSKVARLLMNLLLLRDGYPPAVIHSIDRQRYYDVLRGENPGLVQLVGESLKNGVDTAIHFFDELREARRAQRKAS
ncbi:MAG: Fic family protein [Candidatus Sericytochromatia bacterium]|uniref:Fic family protein n=1 Tax=Candidatus Tanganyikabacteria bacterium TaxID=2961651 RepID=A0A937X4I6_9BACT|nr:Fic family protein [Candidatus Tanganyikabacteria bacterium]